MSERRFPIMHSWAKKVPPHPTSIPWSVAEKAYSQYREHHNQSLEKLAERGGWSAYEMDMLYPGWREEVDALAQSLRLIEQARDALVAIAEHEPCKARAFCRCVACAHSHLARRTHPALTAWLEKNDAPTD